jgi:putative ABC transport system substrate-binding protein
MIRRREFITFLGGAVVWPLAARAQQRERMRRIGVFLNLTADDPQSLARVTAFAQGLAELGWTVGRNLQIDYRWGPDTNRYRGYAAELVALAPDVILSNSTTMVRALQQATRAVPIVFMGIADPVGSGLVASLAQPGSNTTGFMSSEYGTSGKLLELLKQIAPRVTRAAVLRNPTAPAGGAQFGALQAVAPFLGMEIRPIDVRDAGEIERAITASAPEANSGLIVFAGGFGVNHRGLIIALAARHRLPAVYASRYFVADGGLISYGPDSLDPYRRAAGYADRILKGEKPADLPVQAPTKYELVINLKTAKALGLEIPPTLYARADEVIE